MQRTSLKIHFQRSLIPFMHIVPRLTNYISSTVRILDSLFHPPSSRLVQLLHSSREGNSLVKFILLNGTCWNTCTHIWLVLVSFAGVLISVNLPMPFTMLPAGLLQLTPSRRQSYHTHTTMYIRIAATWTTWTFSSKSMTILYSMPI